MYRARVETVSGLKVRAGGKWLTCIGNRVVRAGDMIWTDGRCVYGHDREAQTPLVIVNPAKEDTAIPIQIGNSLYTYRKDKLELVGEMPRGLRLLNNKKRSVYGLTADAANIDATGDLYVINDSNGAYFDYSAQNSTAPYGNSPVECVNPNPRIVVKKNGNTIKELSLNDIIESTAAVAKENSGGWANTPQPYTFIEPVYPGPTHGDAVFAVYDDTRSARVLYAFIENADSWAIIYSVSAKYEYSLDWWSWGEGYYPGEPLYYLHIAQSDVLRLYYINSSGEKKILYQINLVWNRTDESNASGVRLGYWIYEYLGTFTEEVVVSDTDVKIPMQDGYYFKVTYNHAPRVAYPYLVWMPTTVAQYSIFSPENDFLCNVGSLELEENVGNYIAAYQPCFFTAQKISAEEHLVGVQAPDLGGLYTVKGGTLSQLLNENCQNYCLRPMKKYRHWWERIQTVDEGGEENE